MKSVMIRRGTMIVVFFRNCLPPFFGVVRIKHRRAAFGCSFLRHAIHSPVVFATVVTVFRFCRDGGGGGDDAEGAGGSRGGEMKLLPPPKLPKGFRREIHGISAEQEDDDICCVGVVSFGRFLVL